MTRHSTLIGGSTAERLLNCPGSYRAIISLPPQPEIRSEAADEGTHCHHIMDALMQARMSDNSTNLMEEARIWLGDVFYDREFTEETLQNLIFPALMSLAILEEEYGGGFAVAAIEMTADFPGIIGAGGTADLLLVSNSHVMLVDWKFGSVVVRAVLDGDGGAMLNPQLLFYLCAARDEKPKLFTDRTIVAAIVQPRTNPQFSHTDVAPVELDMFEEDVAAAVTVALGRDAPLHRGQWCKWCPAKPQCVEWLKPLIDLATLGKAPPPTANDKRVSSMPTPYGEQLARAKELSGLVSAFAREVDRQMEYYIRSGGIVPGWTLEPKKKQRKWVDPAVVVPALIQMGFRDDEIWKHELQTFEVTDAAARKRGKTIPAHLRVAPETDEMNIVRGDHEHKYIDSSDLIEQLKASVALIDQQKGTTNGK